MKFCRTKTAMFIIAMQAMFCLPLCGFPTCTVGGEPQNSPLSPSHGVSYDDFIERREQVLPAQGRPPTAATDPYLLGGTVTEAFEKSREPWTWQVVPDGLIYHSYIAGPKEPRFSSVLLYDQNRNNWVWDSTLGARVGLLRYGTTAARDVRGWQFDLEGAALVRLEVAHKEDLESADFRFGALTTYSDGPLDLKFGYTHLSSHVGDEYLIRNPSFERLNYVSESLVWGASLQTTKELRIYGETAYGISIGGGAGRWQFQTGAEYSVVPRIPGHAAPFVAINAQLREEVNYGGGLTLMSGWQWRGVESGRTFRVGAMYFNGKSNQFEFYRRNDEQLGLGIWYDF